MPMPLFSRLGASNSSVGEFSVIGKGRNAGAGNSTSGTPGSNQAIGRTGTSPHATTNAGSDVQVFQNYAFTALGQSQTFPLPADGDFNALVVTVSVSVGTVTQTTDILNYFGPNGWEIVAADGPIIDMNVNPDFYLFQQRFGQYGVTPSVTNVTTTTATQTISGTYYVSGINLPKAQGPYTLNITLNSNNPGGAAANFVNVTVSLSLVIGSCPSGLRTRYKENSLPFTPAASGTQDLAPVAAIQGPTLQELFLYNLTAQTADIAYLQVQSAGSTLGTRTPGSGIYARDLAALSGALPTPALNLSGTQIGAKYVLYPLLAFHTGLILDRSAHFYITWGASPSTTIVVGYYWLE